MEIFQTPKYSGWWVIGGKYGLKFAVVKRPNWFHRTMMRLLLNTEWEPTL